MNKHIVILWNIKPSLYTKLASEIELYWDFQGGVILNLNNKLQDFVSDIYLNNAKKISMKIQSMLKRSSRLVCVLYYEGNKNYDAKYVKKTIRNRFSHVVFDYLYDNLIHISDDKNEFLSNCAVVNKYASLEYSRFCK